VTNRRFLLTAKAGETEHLAQYLRRVGERRFGEHPWQKTPAPSGESAGGACIIGARGVLSPTLS
jgi:hypothetical protein